MKKNMKEGSVKSYAIGFLLSLALTFIPYYLVDKQSVTGTALLVTILGFAVLQMIVQVTFFLHLGRGPKPNWNLFFFVATLGIVLMVVGGSVMIINNLHYNMSPTDQTKKLMNDEAIYQIGGAKTGACEGQHANHQVTIVNDRVSPILTDAERCDTLTFISKDEEDREIAFGPHPTHDSYAGESILDVRKGRNKTITLSESGTYEFHDHLQPEVAGHITINP